MFNWLIEHTIFAHIVCFFTGHDMKLIGNGLFHCQRCGHYGDVKELVL